MPTLLLVRHGQASFGTADYDRLSELGHRQAEVVAQTLASRGTVVSRIVSGSLVRQRETAAPLAQALGLEPEIDAAWNEYDTDGILACHSGAGLRLEHGDDAPAVSNEAFQDVLDRALLDWVAAGETGPAPETWTGFAARVGGALERLCRELGPGETAVACTSGGALAAACSGLLESVSAFVPLQRVAVNAGITRVVSGRRGISLLSFNDHSHLEAAGGRGLVTFR